MGYGYAGNGEPIVPLAGIPVSVKKERIVDFDWLSAAIGALCGATALAVGVVMYARYAAD